MQSQHHPGHRFNDINRLRKPERLAMLEVDRVVDLALEASQIQAILDIGTGTGVFAEAFYQRGKQVTGVDVNPEMLAAARRFVPEADFQPAAAEKLPFPDSNFDLVFMGMVLHEMDDLPQALQEAFRVTRHQLVVLEWPYAEQDIGPGLDERLPPEKVKQLAGQAGFIAKGVYPLEHLVVYRFEKEPAREGSIKPAK